MLKVQVNEARSVDQNIGICIKISEIKPYPVA